MEANVQPGQAAQFVGLSATSTSCDECAGQATSRCLAQTSELASGSNIATGTTIWGRSVRSVRIDRAIATANFPAKHTESQVHPLIARL